MKRLFTILVAIFVGTIAGFLSVTSVLFIFGSPEIPHSSIPGLFFGLAMGLYFFLYKRKSFRPLALFVVCSSISSFVAIMVYVFGLDTSADIIKLPISGLIGAAILLLGMHFSVCKLTVMKYFFLTILGGVLSFSWYLIPAIFPPDPHALFGGLANIYSLFIIWPAGMAGGLGWVMSTRKVIGRKSKKS